MKLIKYLFVLLILVSLAIIFTPLKLYYNQIDKQLRPIKFENISGSIVKGSAQKLKYLGLNLGQADWLIYPSSYDTIKVDWRLKDALYDVIGEYKKSTNTEEIRNVKGSFDWSMIDKYVRMNHVKLAGYVAFDFKQLSFRDGTPDRIIGKAITKEFRMLKPSSKDLGEIEVVFNSDNPVIIVGQVNSRSNVINVSGAIYIHKDHRWEVKLNLIPMPGEYEIEYAIQNIGDKRAGGGRALNLAGFY
jgi:hypothetical protein